MRLPISREPALWPGLGIGLALIAIVTTALLQVHGSRSTPALVLVLPVVLAGMAGGRRAAIATAVAAALAFDLAFIPTQWTLKISKLEDLVALLVFLVVAAVVGSLVAQEVDRRRAAEQRTAEIQALYERYEAVVAERERLSAEANRLALLERIDEQRAALLRSVSHDLRTPLATIRAATSDIRAGAGYDDATRDELLELVGDEAERLDRLVANLLSLSRIEAGALHPDRQAVALDELLADCVRRLTRLFIDVSVRVELPPSLPFIDADYSQLDQVITNLLENAARHAPPGSEVVVTASSRDGQIEVVVADDGAGLPADLAAEVFEPFRQGPGGGSSGIGLAICRALVEAHGGIIGVRPAPAGGAEFYFTLPMRPEGPS
jgi:two-component system sensor histidine kinase KdpD